ncbi:exonuclease domain-containing protein [Streptomyces boncukensis]|uniref:3'-5' exonuclease n=1 Tax=Streptomyces boncukensis TaxID=2711219 RepID=A0A6G4X6F7_9ACTN|nr:3'-5' exonuclease [Streptomyces boncukensis]
MTSWHSGRLCGFDLETTGVDVESDRIVTACVVQCRGGQPTTSATWLADPGIEISEGAAAVHGITTERARAEGRPAAEVVEQVTTALTRAVWDGIPIVAMNASFDLTMLDRECTRHGVPAPWAATTPLIVDPRVLDKQVDRYRRGKRTLSALCDHYQVALDGAHSADGDAIAACRVAWRIGTQHPNIGDADLRELHNLQVTWAAEQAEGLREHFARTPGKEHQAASVRGEWPLIPRPRTAS